MVERFNRTLHGLLATLEEEEKNRWPEHLPAVVSQYNATPHATTGFSPFLLFYGREPNLPFDLRPEVDPEPVDEWVMVIRDRQRRLQEAVEINVRRRKEINRRTREEKAHESSWEVGQEVLLRNNVKIGRCKLQNHWFDTRWHIVEVLNPRPGLYRIEPSGGEDLEARVENRSNLKAAPTLRHPGDPAMDESEDEDKEPPPQMSKMKRSSSERSIEPPTERRSRQITV